MVPSVVTAQPLYSILARTRACLFWFSVQVFLHRSHENNDGSFYHYYYDYYCCCWCCGERRRIRFNGTYCEDAGEREVGVMGEKWAYDFTIWRLEFSIVRGRGFWRALLSQSVWSFTVYDFFFQQFTINHKRNLKPKLRNIVSIIGRLLSIVHEIKRRTGCGYPQSWNFIFSLNSCNLTKMDDKQWLPSERKKQTSERRKKKLCEQTSIFNGTATRKLQHHRAGWMHRVW